MVPQQAERIVMVLDALDQATAIEQLDIPGFRLHQLSGNRRGTWSITVTANYRITFEFEEGHAYHVDYEDYH